MAHAVVVRVKIDEGHESDADQALESQVIPRVKEAPGFVAGYWTRSSDGQSGMGFPVFESGDAAGQGAEMARNMPRPEFGHVESVEVREVVAQA